MKNVKLEYDPISIRWMSYHTALKGFFDDVAGLPNIPKNSKKGEGKNTKVIYATPSSAFTKYVIPMVNGLTQHPIISFYLANETTINDVSGNGISTFTLWEPTETKTEYNKISFNRPVLKSLSYVCNLFTTKMADCDYILTELECNCNKFRPFYCKINNRPAQFYLDDVESATPVDYEGKKFIRSTFKMNVPRAAIFPADIEVDDAVITKITNYLYGGDDLLDVDVIAPKEEN